MGLPAARVPTADWALRGLTSYQALFRIHRMGQPYSRQERGSIAGSPAYSAWPSSSLPLGFPGELRVSSSEGCRVIPNPAHVLGGQGVCWVAEAITESIGGLLRA